MLQQGYMNYNDPLFAGMMWKVWSMIGRAFSGFAQIGSTQSFGKNESNLGLSAFPKVNHVSITIAMIS